MDQADNLRKLANQKNSRNKPHDKRENKATQGPVRVIAVTSGKGGVGKTNVVANLAFGLSTHNKKVLIFDADTGLGNIDILLGLVPKYTLNHVLKREKDIKEVIIDFQNGIKVLPAASGIQQLTNLTRDQRLIISEEFDALAKDYDIILLDTGAGISSNVTFFCSAAHEIIVVATPEPTSLTDAYALIKVLFQNHSQNQFKLLVNLAKSEKEAINVYKQLSSVLHRFLPLISLDYIGAVLYDENVLKSVRMQKPVVDCYPYSKASKGFFEMVEKIIGEDLTLTQTEKKVNLFS